MNKALIVDDSKTAQHLLARMLKKYPLEIDTALSAEDALLYLGHHHPAVIFLDQNMTGMNGIEALKTIRANPHTALVPVIMYTAQDDDLFVNEAIALGAQGIFSKSGMLPSNLEQVLRGLRIYPTDGEAGAGEDITQPMAVANLPATRAPAQPMPRERAISDMDRIRTQITRQFEIHSTDISNQIHSAANSVIKRISTDINAAQRRDAQSAEATSTLLLAAVRNEVGDAVEHRVRTGRTLARAMVAVALIALVVTALLAWSAFGELQQTITALTATLQSRKINDNTAPAINAVIPAAVASETKPVPNPALLHAVTWMQNADLEFDYGEPALNPTRIAQLNTLVQLLAEGGYTGPLKIDIHFGNFCLESDKAGGWRIARSDLPVSACKMFKELNQRLLPADYMTLAYRNFEKNSPPLQSGRLIPEVALANTDAPRADYPLMRSSTTAGEWNRAAARNNRIGIRLGER